MRDRNGYGKQMARVFMHVHARVFVHVFVCACSDTRAGYFLSLASPAPRTVMCLSRSVASNVRPLIRCLTFTRTVIGFEAMCALNELCTASPQAISNPAAKAGKVER